MSEKHDGKKMAQVADSLPEDTFAGLRKEVDKGYAKFLKKRGLDQNRTKFNYGDLRKGR